MPKYDIETFRNIVSEIKNNYKPGQTSQKCNLCKGSMGGCEKCPAMLGNDFNMILEGLPKARNYAAPTKNYEASGNVGRGRGREGQPNESQQWGNQRFEKYPQQKYGNQRNYTQGTKYPEPKFENQRNYQDRKRYPDEKRENQRNYQEKKNYPEKIEDQRNYQDRKKYLDEKYVNQRNYPEKKDYTNQILENKKFFEEIKKEVENKVKNDQIPLESKNILEDIFDDKLDFEKNIKNVAQSSKQQEREKSQIAPKILSPKKNIGKETKFRISANVFVPKVKEIVNDTRKRKLSLEKIDSESSEIKRRKKAEQVVQSFSKIINDFSSAIENNEDNEKSIAFAAESITENLESYTNSLNRSRSNLDLSLGEVESVKSIVYKELSEELQFLYELSTNLEGKWRKNVVTTGAENISAILAEKRQTFPTDFITKIDDEIEDGITKLKVSDGKPEDILPILNLVNDADYSLKFLTFVQGIKAQGNLSLKPERIQEVIKEYIIEDLNSKSKKETKKLVLLSQVLAKIETKKYIETINSAVSVSISSLLQMAKRAEQYFLEVAEILQLPVSKADEDKNSLLSKGAASPEAAWKRALFKYSPVKDVTVSPLKQCEANLSPTMSTDSVFLALAWVLEMSEQFYFDNTLMLTNQKKENPTDICGMLRVNFQPFDAQLVKEIFTNVVVIGSGSFGDVYRVSKKGTDDHFAIKYMKRFPPGLFQAHFKTILNFMQERNYVIAAKNSPYVVKFIQSFKIPNLNGYFLIFEWCLDDLRHFVNFLTFNDPKSVSVSLWESEKNVIAKFFQKAKEKYDMDFEPVVIIYTFEMFCVLDFLAKSNIIHQDLKPENVMISRNLHLKVGDFGLVFNTKFITVPHQSYLMDFEDLEYFVNEPLQQTFGGTELYADMELSFKMLNHYYPDDAKELIYHPDSFDYDISTAQSDPNFLSDLWSVGIIITEMLLGGILFLYDESIETYVQRDMEITGNHKKVLLEITYLKNNYKRYIAEGLNAFGGEKFQALMSLLASIFKPREFRAEEFVTEKEIYFYKKKTVQRHIDISKIEKIDIFRKMDLHSHNAFLFEIPNKLSTLLNKRLKIQYQTFGDLLSSTVDENEEQVLNLIPGTEVHI